MQSPVKGRGGVSEEMLMTREEAEDEFPSVSLLFCQGMTSKFLSRLLSSPPKQALLVPSLSLLLGAERKAR